MIKKDKYSSLKDYLSRGHTIINQALRKPELMNDEINAKVDEINTTLDNVKSFDNSVVYHCGDIGGVTVEKLWKFFRKRINSNIQIPGFLSTTKDPDFYFKNQPKVFKISTSIKSNAKDVTNLAFDKPNEGEVLFKSGTYFKIIDSKPDLITLCELSEPPEEFEVLDEDYFFKDHEIYINVRPNNNMNKSLTDQNLI